MCCNVVHNSTVSNKGCPDLYKNAVMLYIIQQSAIKVIKTSMSNAVKQYIIQQSAIKVIKTSMRNAVM